MTLCASQISGQDLFSLSTLNDSVLSASQLARKQVFLASTNTESLTLIHVNNILRLQDSNVIGVRLPERTDTFYFKGTYIEFIDTTTFNWTGELVHFENGIISEDTISDGNLTLLYYPDRIYGEISVDSLYYMIRDLTGGVSALIKLNDSIFSETCGMINLPGDITGLTPPPSPPPTSPFLQACPLNVLVLFTEQALAEHPDIEDLLKIGLLNTNDILKNSDVSRAILFFDDVTTAMVPISEFEESGNIDVDKEYIHTNQYIKALRDEYEADIVVVLTSNVYSNLSGAVSAFGLDDGSSIDEAYAIVEAEHISLPYYTLSHELFHLYGAHHEQKETGPADTRCVGNGDDSGNMDAHGYLVNGKSRRKRRHTIMAICGQDMLNPENIRKIKHLSNPNVKFKRWPTGEEETNYNAKQVRDIACVIANYRYTYRPFAYIVGPNQVCSSDEDIVLTAVVGGLEGNYDYYWRYTLDGLNWSAYIETYNNILSIPNIYEPGTSIFFELVTGTTPENMMRAYWSTVIQDDHVLCIRSNPFEGNEVTNDAHSMFSIFPNPTTGTVTIENKVMDATCFELAICNISGHEIKRIKGCTLFTSFDIGEYSDGFYVLKYVNQNGDFGYQKLILHTTK